MAQQEKGTFLSPSECPSPGPIRNVASLTQEATSNLLLSRLQVEADAGPLSAEHPASRSLARADS